jgi:FSR family fosmidomycin resistance protein-like MFS transporter
MNQNTEGALASPSLDVTATRLGVLYCLSLCHFLNDTIQAVLPAIYPLLKSVHGLSFTQIGIIALTFQLTASLLQPWVGFVTDRRPQPYSLAIGMGATLIGLLMLSQASGLPMILVSSSLVGLGSSVFHPEASRLAQLASGGRHGFAQSLFQVGGNLGSSFGPLLAAWLVMPGGQPAVAWFAVLALLAIALLQRLGHWYQQQLALRARGNQRAARVKRHSLSNRQVAGAIIVLVLLIISKYFYLVSLVNYYTFYLIDRFQVSVQTSQLCLFLFLFSVAAGTIIGGPIGDRHGRKFVIWVSILGTAPFSLALPYANLPGTIILSMFAGLILASAFSAILVFAQDLLPGKVGMVAGLFFGFAFGVGGIASAVLGVCADQVGIQTIFKLCAFFPLFGLLTVFLPNLNQLDPQLENHTPADAAPVPQPE